MGRHYTKNAWSPVPRTQYIGAQMEERETVARKRSRKTTPKRSRKTIRERKGWKCDECGLVLKDNPKWLHRHHTQLFCLGCTVEQLGKKHLKQKGRRSYKRYKRFIEQYGKEWKGKRKA